MVDAEWFESVWRSHGRDVTRYCVFSTGSREEGEDAASETFARFLAKGGSVPRERTDAWLFTVARNLCASHHRRMLRHRLLALGSPDLAGAEGEAWRDREIWEHVRRLGERERLVVYLRIVDDRPFAEIAAMTRRSESAVKMTFYQALDRLRRELSAEPAPTTVGGAEDVC